MDSRGYEWPHPPAGTFVRSVVSEYSNHATSKEELTEVVNFLLD